MFYFLFPRLGGFTSSDGRFYVRSTRRKEGIMQGGSGKSRTISFVLNKC